jgi:hypothetical protein
MGFLKMVFWSLFGPFLIWLALVGHVVYQVAVQSPGPIKTTGWPEGTSESMKSTLISNRKYILQDFVDLMKTGDQAKAKKFIENRITDDFVWEDPMEKFVGKAEFADLLYLCKYVKDIEFKTFSEHHSTHEMILDWSLKVTTTLLPSFPFTIPMRTHFLLEPAEQVNKTKLFERHKTRLTTSRL